MNFELRGEYIELIKLLKATGLVMSGGEAKRVVEEGLVTVDGEVETRKRNKIRPGQVVGFDGESVEVDGPTRST
jgi:ribosome-associated protein